MSNINLMKNCPLKRESELFKVSNTSEILFYINLYILVSLIKQVKV